MVGIISRMMDNDDVKMLTMAMIMMMAMRFVVVGIISRLMDNDDVKMLTMAMIMMMAMSL